MEMLSESESGGLDESDENENEGFNESEVNENESDGLDESESDEHYSGGLKRNMRSKERCSSCSRTRVHYFSTYCPPTCRNTTIKLLISKLPASVPKTKAAKCKTSCQVPVGEKVLNPCSYKFMCKVNNQQLLSICVGTSHDRYLCFQIE